jgi:hypothetical protein
MIDIYQDIIGQGTVADDCNPTYLGGKDQEALFKSSPDTKVQETLHLNR